MEKSRLRPDMSVIAMYDSTAMDMSEKRAPGNLRFLPGELRPLGDSFSSRALCSSGSSLPPEVMCSFGTKGSFQNQRSILIAVNYYITVILKKK